MTVEPWWRPTAGGVLVSVRVTPGARRSEIIGITDGRLRLRIAAPPVDGKANEAIRRFVADAFGVRRAAVTIVAGDRGREKSVRILGVDRPPPDLLIDRRG